MTKKWLRGIAYGMSVVVAASTASVYMPQSYANENEVNSEAGVQGEVVLPDYKWDFENTASGENVSTGNNTTAKAILRGTAKTESDSIVIGNKKYASDDNKVLVLGGGIKGSSYVELPSDIYSGVSSDTGFTYSFFAKPDEAVASYSRAISSATSSNGDEFAYAPFASDNVWNVIFDGTNVYRTTYGTEPEKGQWNLITFTVSKDDVILYINGEEAGSSVTAGGPTELKKRLDVMDTLVNNALGKTCSGWGDPDCKISLDDVSLYKKALSSEEVAEIAKGYGFEVKAEASEKGGATELTDGTTVNAIDELKVKSPDESLEVFVSTNEADGSFYYSVNKSGKNVINASQLGVNADEDFTKNMAYVSGSFEITDGVEAYSLTSGKKKEVNDAYNQLSFELCNKDNESKKIKIIIKAFDTGVAYSYVLYGAAGELLEIKNEASEFVLPADAVVWSGNTDVNYEFEYTKKTMKTIKAYEGNLSIPLLANTEDNWILLTEAGVLADSEPYCSSFLSSVSDTRNLKVTFGNKQTTSVKKTFDENGEIKTPWRVAAIAENLDKLVNTNIVTDLNPDYDNELYADTSYIRSGKVAWSWWSEAGDDPVEYEQQKDYIDFAADNGWEYVCVDFGWCLWDDYKAKVKELVDYAAEKNVSIILWYGVNNANHAGFKDAKGNAAYPKYSLKTTEQLEEQFAWCNSVGVKGVKVDYYESDNQSTMKQMYECATIAAKNKINVLFHGCTIPKGEQRTFPNILSYEAIRGAEWYKWNVGSSVASNLTYFFTRNVLGGMDYTPVAMKIDQLNTTAGFQLAQTICYESGFVNVASSVFKLEGYKGLSFINNIPAAFDETKLLDGYPGEYQFVMRRSGDNYYIGGMTTEALNKEISLDFLGDGTYKAYIYSDNEDGTDIEKQVTEVTKESVLNATLLENGGMTVIITKEDINTETPSEDYVYYEAEDSENTLSGTATVIKNQFVSGMERVTGIGKNTSNMLTFNKITAAEAGTYELRVYYSSGTEKRICFKVNNGSEIRTQKLSSGVNGVAATSFFINLNKGENTIVFYNSETKAPDVDRIAISKDVREAELTKTDNTDDGIIKPDGAQYEYKIYAASAAKFSGGARLENGAIGWLGNGAACKAVFTVEASETAKYKLQLSYFAGETRNVYVKVGDAAAIKVACPSTGSYTADSAEEVYVDVELNKGTNTITLYNATGWAPNISNIGISTVKTGDIKTDDKKEETEKEDGGKVQNPSSNNSNSNNSNTNNSNTNTNTSKKTAAKSITIKVAGYENDKITLVKGKKITLSVKVSPAKATQKVTYKSSKPSVASVSGKGVITAKKTGTAKITVVSKDKKAKKTITVKVVKKHIENKKLKLKKTKLTLKKKNAVYAIKTSSLTKYTTSKITYKVKSGSRYVKVDKYGNIKCKVTPSKKAKKAVVTVKCGKVSKNITVTIKK